MLSKYIKKQLLNIRQVFIINTPFIKRNIVLSRSACLGNDVLELKKNRGENIVVINQQKVRVDLFMECVNGATRSSYKILKKFIKDDDIFKMIKQQNKLPWLKISKNVKFILIDSFSELTDKKITHKKEGWSFCCHYGDINHTEEFKNNFILNGCLPIEKMG